ncbi:MAG: hypothetical protein IPL41_01545 [Micropruina sp.]|nr:hypothetical protein [Micropruina sp.]
MNKTLRKAFVAAAALLAIVVIPVTAGQDHAGGFSDWPTSKPIRNIK